jgi:Holliday junction resolvasome RuvABC endonuclease subunit
MYIAGIDPSLSGTGIVIISDDEKHQKSTRIESKLLHSNPEDSMDKRLKYLVDEIRKTIHGFRPLEVRLESPALRALGRIAELSALYYMIRAMLVEENIRFHVVPPPTWKKHMLGKGNAKKDLLLKIVYKKWNVDFDDDNLAVAYCLAKMPKSTLPHPKRKKIRRND